MQLAFDFNVEPEWVPLYKPYGVTLLSLVTDRGCRDCGGKTDGCGGSREQGTFEICPGCRQLDGCLERESSTPGQHCSRWGETHPAADHDALVTEREQRRAAWRKRAAKAGGALVGASTE